MFTWIPIHREAIHQILEYQQRENELLAILYEMEQKGLKVISLQDEDAQGKTIPYEGNGVKSLSLNLAKFRWHP